MGSELESWSATGASGARQINRRLPRTSLSEAKGELERETGFEPATSTLARSRSTK